MQPNIYRMSKWPLADCRHGSHLGQFWKVKTINTHECLRGGGAWGSAEVEHRPALHIQYAWKPSWVGVCSDPIEHIHVCNEAEASFLLVREGKQTSLRPLRLCCHFWTQSENTSGSCYALASGSTRICFNIAEAAQWHLLSLSPLSVSFLLFYMHFSVIKRDSSCKYVLLSPSSLFAFFSVGLYMTSVKEQ